jgi:hypothetical protein
MRLNYSPHGIRPARLLDILIPKGSRFLVPDITSSHRTSHQETKEYSTNCFRRPDVPDEPVLPCFIKFPS